MLNLLLLGSIVDWTQEELGSVVRWTQVYLGSAYTLNPVPREVGVDASWPNLELGAGVLRPNTRLGVEKT
jgi:hypothetical protein